MLTRSPTAFQAVTEMTKRLDKEGFEELKEEDHWKLKKGGNYYVTRNHSAIIAFSIPQKPVWKFHIMASHSDSPSLKIKENPEIEVENAYIKLNVERYGGMILSPWFDRPLSVAGRLIVRQDGKIREKMVAVDRDLLVIPNLAIHMNREVNDGYKYNVQKDMLPLFSDKEGKGRFMETVAELNMSETDRTRLIEAEWQQPDTKEKEKYMAEIQVYANNRTGLLVDLSKIFTERKIDLRSINSRTSKQEKATISMSFEIGSKEELRSLIEKIRQVESVIDVERTTG